MELRPRKILVRGTNWLGDAVMTTPALEKLRARFPASHIALLTHSKLAGLWENQPVVDAVMSFERGDSLPGIASRLRRETFDLALLFPNSPRAALEAWLAGIPVRVGRSSLLRRWFLTHPVTISSSAFAMPKRSPRDIRRILSGSMSDENSDDRLEFPGSDRRKLPVPNENCSQPTNPRWEGETPSSQGWAGTISGLHRVSPSPVHGKETDLACAALGAKRHHLYQYLELTCALGCSNELTPPRLVVDPASESSASEKFGLDPSIQWVGINAGAEYGPAKRWPAESYAKCAAALLRESGCGLVFLGGPGDVETASLTANKAGAAAGGSQRIRILAGKTSLKELCAVLKRCAVVLTNDTGPMHVAAAVGTPVVALFGSTSPEMTGPGLPDSPNVRILRNPPPCAPCFLRKCPIDLRCLTRIDPVVVTRAVLSLMSSHCS